MFVSDIQMVAQNRTHVSADCQSAESYARGDVIMNAKTIYEYECDIEEILDDALNKLWHEAFERLLDGISMMLADYEE